MDTLSFKHTGASSSPAPQQKQQQTRPRTAAPAAAAGNCAAPGSCATAGTQPHPGGRSTSRAAPQIRFDTSLPSEPDVGIIGGGLSGVALASELSARGIRCTVYDTGEHGVGGRMATREGLGGDGRLRFDHAAQYLTAET